MIECFQSSSGKNSGMEGDLTTTKHELLRVRDMLEMAEKVTTGKSLDT